MIHRWSLEWLHIVDMGSDMSRMPMPQTNENGKALPRSASVECQGIPVTQLWMMANRWKPLTCSWKLYVQKVPNQVFFSQMTVLVPVHTIPLHKAPQRTSQLLPCSCIKWMNWVPGLLPYLHPSIWSVDLSFKPFVPISQSLPGFEDPVAWAVVPGMINTVWEVVL